MITFPNELGGSHPLAAWGNKLLRAAKAASLVTGVGYKLQASSSGTVLQIMDEAKAVLPFTICRTDSWLKFKVSTGYVIASDHAFVPTYAGDGHEFTITSGVSKFYFVLAITSPTTGSISTSSTLPAWGIDVIPIGFVDTNTYSASSASVITQFIHDNIFSPCVV